MDVNEKSLVFIIGVRGGVPRWSIPFNFPFLPLPEKDTQGVINLQLQSAKRSCFMRKILFLMDFRLEFK